MSKHPRFYRPELDVLRCMAFLLVFLSHSALFPTGILAQVRFAGTFGLCLFFFLSAFLITELLEREAQSTGTIRLGAFYIRRILRIWPLYFAVVLIAFAHMQLRQPGVFTLGRLFAFLLLAGNWFIARHGFVFSFAMPLWSISIEEQFYLLWPSFRRFAGRSASVLLSICVLALAFVVLVWLCRTGTDVEVGIWVNSFVQFQFFASGALTAFVLRGRQPSWPSWTRGLLFCSGLLAFLLAQTLCHVRMGVAPPSVSLVCAGYGLADAGCLAIFLSLLGASAPQRWTPLIYLGRISYGLYSFHYALLMLCGKALEIWAGTNPALRHLFLPLRAAMALSCTICLAAFSYRFFEAPILRFKRRFEVIRTRPVGV